VDEHDLAAQFLEGERLAVEVGEGELLVHHRTELVGGGLLGAGRDRGFLDLVLRRHGEAQEAAQRGDEHLHGHLQGTGVELAR